MRMLLLAGVALPAMASATAKNGYLAITDASTVASLGWVSQTLNSYGEYVTATDANLGAGSSNYAVLSAATLTALGAAPALRNISSTDSSGLPVATEASIWSQSGTASPLSAQWVSTDNSLPGTSTLLVNGLLVLTGDPATFIDQYGLATLASLTLVPSGASVSLTLVPAPASLPVLGSGLLDLLMARCRT